jgi:LmbE family N-acetylglucosaminyl deacetylase
MRRWRSRSPFANNIAAGYYSLIVKIVGIACGIYFTKMEEALEKSCQTDILSSIGYNLDMTTIYLSPHLDDAALSCGGLIWQQAQAGEQVQVWTVCAGELPPGPLSLFAQVLHKRWEIEDDCVVTERRREDLLATRILCASVQHLSIPDAIYRRHPKTNEILYNTWEDVQAGIAPGEERLVDRLAIELAKLLPPDAVLVAPLTIGNHVDHLITRVAAGQLRRSIKYYLDFPYVKEFAEVIPELIPAGYRQVVYPISEKGLEAWQEGIAAYSSQISSFWPSINQMRTAVQEHCEQFGGIVLWEFEG